MLVCPNCQDRLQRTMAEKGVLWICPSCGGHAASISLLRQLVVQEEVNKLWQKAWQASERGSRVCPACQNHMFAVPVTEGPETFQLDVCKGCQFVWFDQQEFEAMPRVPPPPPQTKEADSLPQAAREIIAIEKARLIGERDRDDGGDYGVNAPEEWWKYLPALLGFPVEYNNPVSRIPWATVSVALSVTIISLWAFTDLRSAVEEYGFVASQPGRLGGLTVLTAFFLHGSILHLVGNMYFLLVFGDNVEEYLGKQRFLILLLLSTVTGALFHLLLNPDSTLPCVGASGGISGLIMFYALQFPKAQLGFLLRFVWVRIPAYFALGLWIVYQVLLAALQVRGLSRVGALAHLGGAAMGFVFWVWVRQAAKTAEKPPVRKTTADISP